MMLKIPKTKDSILPMHVIWYKLLQTEWTHILYNNKFMDKFHFSF